MQMKDEGKGSIYEDKSKGATKTTMHCDFSLAGWWLQENSGYIS